MKIGPHHVAETIRDSKLSRDMWRAPHTMPAFAGLIARAVPFDFGQIRPDQAHIDFGLDLIDRDLFALPFPITAVSFQGQASHLQMRDRIRGGMVILYQHDEGKGISAITCNETVDQAGRTVGAIPVALISRARFVNRSGTTVDALATTQAIVSDQVIAAMYGPGEAGHDVMTQRAADNLLQCIGLVVMLMSRGVESKRIEAPAKLNKAREAKGKPIIADRYEVSLQIGSVYSIAQQDEPDENIEGHKRGAVRMHWRRGHFRTLRRGGEGERTVPVAPTIVNANDEMRSRIAPKTYRVAS